MLCSSINANKGNPAFSPFACWCLKYPCKIPKEKFRPVQIMRKYRVIGEEVTFWVIGFLSCCQGVGCDEGRATLQLPRAPGPPAECPVVTSGFRLCLYRGRWFFCSQMAHLQAGTHTASSGWVCSSGRSFLKVMLELRNGKLLCWNDASSCAEFQICLFLFRNKLWLGWNWVALFGN